MVEQGVSLRPSTFVDVGVVPVDKDLLWKKCEFVFFDYINKAGETVATTTAGQITYEDTATGEEHVVQYSVSDPKRFEPSADGKSLVAAVKGTPLNRSCNFYVLQDALVKAGFPEDKLGADFTALEGLITHNIGVPEPGRAGLERTPKAEGEKVYPKVISVPESIIKLPWDKKGTKATGSKTKASAPAETSAEAGSDAIGMVMEALADADSVTRQQIAAKAIRAKKGDIAKVVFTPEFGEALAEAGLVLEGENISLATE